MRSVPNAHAPTTHVHENRYSPTTHAYTSTLARPSLATTLSAADLLDYEYEYEYF